VPEAGLPRANGLKESSDGLERLHAADGGHVRSFGKAAPGPIDGCRGLAAAFSSRHVAVALNASAGMVYAGRAVDAGARAAAKRTPIYD
jgi:hypothetical protein